MHRIVVVLGLFCLLACQRSGEAPSHSTVGEAAQDLAQAKALKLLDSEDFLASVQADPQAILIDCRTPTEFAGGSLPRAVNLDFRAPDFEQQVLALDTAHSVYVFCQKGGRSARAAQVFAKAGFEEVYDLQGGYGGLGR